MPDVTKGVNSRSSGGAEHGRHDRLLVARFGAGDAYPSEQEEARALVARCGDCARLAEDIGALRSAAAALPAPRRTRDFRLTAAQADNLRGSSIERWLRRLAAPGLAPVRPLAGVALSIGLVLMVAGVALPTPAGELAALQQDAGANSVPEFAEAPGAAKTGPPPPSAPFASGGLGGLTPDETDDTRMQRDGDFVDVALDNELEQAESTRQLLITSGLVMGLTSLGVLLVVIVARRRARDPLLR